MGKHLLLQKPSATPDIDGSAKFSQLWGLVLGQLIQNLRGKIRILETNLAVTTEELNRLKLDGKYLRVRELETEVKAYYSAQGHGRPLLCAPMHSLAEFYLSMPDSPNRRRRTFPPPALVSGLYEGLAPPVSPTQNNTDG